MGARVVALLYIVLQLTVAVAAGSVALTPVQAEIEARSGSTITLGVRVRNADAAQVVLELRPELPSGWSVLIPPGEVSVAGRDTRVALVTVKAPAGASAGTYPLALRAVESGAVESDANALARADFSVTIPLIERASLSRAAGPEYATGTEYTTSFLLRNEGNGTGTWRLAARSSADLEVTVDPGRVSLEPGAAARIAVHTTLPTELRESTTHVITLMARRGPAVDADAEARSTTMLLPVDPPDAPAMHMYPLTAQVEFGVGMDDGASASPPRASLSGEGRLPGSDGILAIDLAGRPTDPVGSADLKVSYLAGWGEISVGHQSFERSDLAGSARGFGVAVDRSWDAATLTVSTDANLYIAAADGAVSGSAGVDVSSPGGLHVGAHGHTGASGPIGTIVAGYRGSSSESSGVSLTSVGVTYGVRPAASGWRAGHAVRLRGSAHGGPVSLAASYRLDTASFSRSHAHGSELDLSTAVRVPEDLGFAGMPEIVLRARFTEARAWSDADSWQGTPAADGTEAELDAVDSVERTFGVTLAASVADIALVLGHRETWAHGIGTSHRGSVTHVQATASLSERFELQQKLEWARVSGATEDAIRNEASIAWSGMGEGDFTVGYVLDLGLSTFALSEASLKAEWSGELAPSLAVAAGVDVDLGGDDRGAGVDLALSAPLSNGHTLLIEGSGALRADRGPSASLAVTYTLPFQVALGPRRDVGLIRGKVLTYQGEPLAGAVVSAAGGLGVTDAHGAYVVRNVPTGSHTVHLLTDTVTLPDPVVDPSKPPQVEIAAGAVVEVDFSVSPGATLMGRIVPVLESEPSANGAVGPDTGSESWIAGATVELTDGNVVLRGVTDASGRFRFPGLAAGTWTVRLVRPGLPDDWRLEGAEQTFHLAPGDEREMLVNLVAVQRTIRFQDGGSVGRGD